MDIQITSRHEKASPSLQTTINSEFAKLEKYFDRITSCHVIIDSERGMDIMEVTMNISGHSINATARAENLGKALDEVIAKVERQLKKITEKFKNHKNSD
jgi:putative sigma-54 modulation protein